MPGLKRSFIEAHVTFLRDVPVSWEVPHNKYYELNLKMCQLQSLKFDFTWEDNRTTATHTAVERPVIEQSSRILRMDVSLNELQSLDHDGLLPFQELRSLDASLNRLERIVGVEVLPHLRVLNVSHNFLRYLHGLERSRLLTELNAAVNELMDISYIPHLPNLTVLHINNNKLTSLQGVQVLTQLRELYAQKNNVSDIVPVAGCLRLNFLDVSYNNIKSIYTAAEVIRDLHKLSVVNLYGNPIEKEAGYQSSFLSIDHLLTLDNVNIKAKPRESKYGKNLYSSGSEVDRLKETAKQAFIARLHDQKQKMQDTTRFLHQRILSVQQEYEEYEAKMKRDLDACLEYLDSLTLAEQKLYNFDLLRETVNSPHPKPWQAPINRPKPKQSSHDLKNIRDTDEVLRLAFNKLAKEQANNTDS